MNCTKCDRCGIVGAEPKLERIGDKWIAQPHAGGVIDRVRWSKIAGVGLEHWDKEMEARKMFSYELCSSCTEEVWKFIQQPKPPGTGFE